MTNRFQILKELSFESFGYKKRTYVKKGSYEIDMSSVLQINNMNNMNDISDISTETDIIPIISPIGDDSENTTGGRKISSLQITMQHALMLILSTKKSLIVGLSNFDTSYIKPLFIKAWRWASGQNIVAFDHVQPKNTIEFIMALDPFYTYVYDIQRMQCVALAVLTSSVCCTWPRLAQRRHQRHQRYDVDGLHVSVLLRFRFNVCKTRVRFSDKVRHNRSVEIREIKW